MYSAYFDLDFNSLSNARGRRCVAPPAECYAAWRLPPDWKLNRRRGDGVWHFARLANRQVKERKYLRDVSFLNLRQWFSRTFAPWYFFSFLFFFLFFFCEPTHPDLGGNWIWIMCEAWPRANVLAPTYDTNLFPVEPVALD